MYQCPEERGEVKAKSCQKKKVDTTQNILKIHNYKMGGNVIPCKQATRELSSSIMRTENSTRSSRTPCRIRMSLFLKSTLVAVLSIVSMSRAEDGLSMKVELIPYECSMFCLGFIILLGSWVPPEESTLGCCWSKLTS